MPDKPTYKQIAEDFRLWQEYADPTGQDTKEQFDNRSIDTKIKLLIACFGPEPDPDMIPISQKQREWTKNEIKEIIARLQSMLEERVNLDLSVRLALHHAVDTIKAAESALDQQPTEGAE